MKAIIASKLNSGLIYNENITCKKALNEYLSIKKKS